jgi:hypothetical protein
MVVRPRPPEHDMSALGDFDAARNLSGPRNEKACTNDPQA